MTRDDGSRIDPAQGRLDADVQERIDAVMKGEPPLVLFSTLARDRRLFFKFFDAGLLDRGHLTIRQREIVILRTTAGCEAEYEWGVHVAAFAEKAGSTPAQIRSLTVGGAHDACWDDAERALIEMCDSLHRVAAVEDVLWERLRDSHSEEAIIELLMLAGFYRTVSYLTNALRLPLEATAASFADFVDDGSTGEQAS